MSFVGIEFTDDDDSAGGGIALVSSQWLTPRKREVFWPPYKFQSQYNRAIQKGVAPDQDGSWKIYEIKRCFFETDDYSKAQNKIKQALVTSDCQSEIDDNLSRKRIINKLKRLGSSSSSSSNDENENLSRKHKFPLPPKIAKLNDKIDETLPLSLSRTLKSVQQIAAPDKLNSPDVDLKILRSNTPSDSEHNFRLSFNNSPTTSTAFETSFRDSFHYHDRVDTKILSFLIHIREQNKEILTLLNKQVTSNISAQFRLENLPVNLPVLTQEIRIFWKITYKAIKIYLHATLGGRDVTSKTNRILKYLVTDEVASNYSFYGKRMNKIPFSSLKCCSAVLQSIKSTSSETEKEIEDVIKVWLKHAPQRIKIRNVKNKAPAAFVAPAHY